MIKLKNPKAAFFCPRWPFGSTWGEPAGPTAVNCWDIPQFPELEGTAGAWSCSHHPRWLAHCSGQQPNTYQTVHVWGAVVLNHWEEVMDVYIQSHGSCTTPSYSHKGPEIIFNCLSLRRTSIKQFIQEPLRLIYTHEPDVLFHSGFFFFLLNVPLHRDSLSSAC